MIRHADERPETIAVDRQASGDGLSALRSRLRMRVVRVTSRRLRQCVWWPEHAIGRMLRIQRGWWTADDLARAEREAEQLLALFEDDDGED